MAELEEKQKRFVQEYLIDLNATQAAIRAGYSPKSANQQGSRLCANAKIKDEIAKEMAKRSKRTGISQDRVIEELAKMAFCNIADLTDNNGKIKDDAKREDLACIESIKVKRAKTDNGAVSEEREIKLSSKVKCLELLGKHLGMWSDKIDMNVTLPVVISGEDELE